MAAILPIAVGTMVALQPLAVVAALGGAVLIVAAQQSMLVLLTAISASIAIEAVGHFGISIAGVPITLAKLMILLAIPIWVLRARVLRRPLLVATPMSWGFFAVLLSMTMSMGIGGEFGRSAMRIVTFLLLMMMVHLVVVLSEDVDVPGMYRVIGVLAVVNFATSIALAERESDRLVGWVGNANVWATSVVVLAPVCVAAFAQSKRWYWQLFGGILLMLAMANIGLTASRAGLVAFVVTLPFLVLAYRHQTRLLAIGLVATVALAAYAVDAELLFRRFGSIASDADRTADLSFFLRAESAGLALALFESHPITGVGLELYRQYHAVETSSGIYGVAHNMYLTVLAEQGLVGGAAHLLFFGGLLWAEWALMKKAWGTPEEPVVFGLVGGITAWMVMGLTGGAFYEVQNYFNIGILLGMLRRVRRTGREA